MTADLHPDAWNMKHSRIEPALAPGLRVLSRCLVFVALGILPAAVPVLAVKPSSRPAVASRPADGTAVPDDLTSLSLDDLLGLQVRVTSVTRTSGSAARAPAALFVITQEEIRRSGATSIPEALRLAPGVSVARVDSNKWAISIRGADSRFSNKLLVLMDGRTLYDLLRAGVYWDVQDTMSAFRDRPSSWSPVA